MTVTNLPRCVTGGVDTHLDVHVAAALDERGALLGVESFATTADGYKKLLGWLSDFGPVELVGVEGTGSYGAGLTRHLQGERVRVVEVDRPNRQRRRRKGKLHRPRRPPRLQTPASSSAALRFRATPYARPLSARRSLATRFQTHPPRAAHLRARRLQVPRLQTPILRPRRLLPMLKNRQRSQATAQPRLGQAPLRALLLR